MAVAGDLERWLARMNARPLPRSRPLRLFAVAMATLAGWLEGTTLCGCAMALLEGLDPGDPWLSWRVAAAFSALGCGIAFPVALVWLALLLRKDSALLRVEVAPGFGAACGTALAFGLFAASGGLFVLGMVAGTWFLGLGALVGATTWTAYVLLARWLAARVPAARSPD
jgi:hypothetical protein